MTAPVDAVLQRRLQLRARGYLPIPLFGKVPPLKAWQDYSVISRDMIELWEKVWPNADNTGCLTRYMPALDIDILNEEAARAVEDLAREKFEERGWFLVRIGQAPKRAIIFRTDLPFGKQLINLTAPIGREEKLEFLCAGQQLVVDGIHPDTKQSYRWFGGEPWHIQHNELPYIHPREVFSFIDNATSLLTNHAFGYTRAAAVPKSSYHHGKTTNGGEAAWKYHLDNVLHGRALHDSITQLAAALIRSGMDKGAAIHLLAALLELSETSHDARWEARYREVPRAVDSAVEKYR
jgi:Bifunctional DNA primase/polymerase, N-terminal